MGLATIALDSQPILADRRQMRATRDKGNVRPGRSERCAIRSTNAARADHGDAHALLLLNHPGAI